MTKIRNLTSLAIPLNDLGGITIPASSDFDLSVEHVSYNEIQTSNDLLNAINAGDIVFLDSADNPLTLHESLNALNSSSLVIHGNLLELNTDDHTQYLLVNGTRAMSGALDMGMYNIANVGTIDGVDISAHTSRHLPNGLDALTTAAPSTNLSLSSINDVGIANSFARSDHSHAITGVQPLDNDLTALANIATTGLYTITASGTSTTRTITGTTDRITITNGSGVSDNPTIDIAGTYTGQSSITTLGTIDTGTWNATTIGINKGGTGLTTIGTSNQILGVNAGETGLEYKRLIAGTNITITPASGSLTITSAGGPPAGANTNIQYNNGGEFGAEANFSYDQTLDKLTIYGATANQTRQALLSGTTAITAGQENTSALYIEVDGDSTFEGIRTYFKRSSPGISGWITYHYDGITPNIRITDEDDPPYIQFNTIGTGTYAAPQYVNYFGSRGPTAGATTGFEWRVNGTTIATMDSQFLQQPTGTTANRPGTPTAGMTRYNTTLGQEEVYGAGGWVGNIGIIDKSTIDAVITTAGPNDTFNFTVPGGTLGTDRILRLKLGGRWSNTSGAFRIVIITVSYGGISLWSDISTALNTGTALGWNMEFILSANNSVTSQKLNGTVLLGSTGIVTIGQSGDLATDEILANTQIVGINSSVNSANNNVLAVTVTFNGAGITWTKHYHTLELL